MEIALSLDFTESLPNSLIETPEPAKLVDIYWKDEFNDPDNPLRNTRVKIERARFGVTWNTKQVTQNRGAAGHSIVR